MIGSSSGLSALGLNPANLFNKIDANKDGSVTKEEFIAARPKEVSETDATSLFDSIDSEGTGALNESQLKDGLDKNNQSQANSRDIGNSLADAALQAILQFVQNISSTNDNSSATNKDDLFGKIDADGDGMVTKEEFVSSRPSDLSEEKATQLFASLDTEGTGTISKDQFETGMQANAPQDKPMGKPPAGGAGGAGGASGGGGASSSEDENYDPLDTNEDGTVSMAELLAGLQSKADETSDTNTKALLNAISDAIETYATNNSIDLQSTSTFKAVA